jgi:hypothetical protein
MGFAQLTAPMACSLACPPFLEQGSSPATDRGTATSAPGRRHGFGEVLQGYRAEKAGAAHHSRVSYGREATC